MDLTRRQQAALQAALRAALHSDLPGRRGSSEGDFSHQRVCAEDLPDRGRRLSGARNHIDHPCRDPRLLRQLRGKKKTRQNTGSDSTMCVPRGNKVPTPIQMFDVLTSARARAESGVSSAGLTTTVQPAASAAPTFLVIMALGKFHWKRPKANSLRDVM